MEFPYVKLCRACGIALTKWLALGEAEDANLFKVCKDIAGCHGFKPMSYEKFLSDIRKMVACKDIFHECYESFDSLSDAQYQRLIAGCSEVGYLDTVAELLRLRSAALSPSFRL